MKSKFKKTEKRLPPEYISDIIRSESSSFSVFINKELHRDGLHFSGNGIAAKDDIFNPLFKDYLNSMLKKISSESMELNVSLDKEVISACEDLIRNHANSIIANYESFRREMIEKSGLFIDTYQGNLRNVLEGIVTKEVKSFISKETNRRKRPELIQQIKSNRIALASLIVSGIALIVSGIAVLIAYFKN